MKKILLFATALFSMINVSATPINLSVKLDSAISKKITDDSCIGQLSPSTGQHRNMYVTVPRGTDDYQVDDWRANWFLGVQGGVSVFSGNPMGCADIFDRLSPNIHVYGGKWFTPSVGARISYQGYQIKNCCFSKMDVASFHADLMYNVMGFRYARGNEQKVDIIPFLGCGLIRNLTTHTNPFSMNYGLQTRCHLNDRLHLTAELSGLLTSQTFDAAGKKNRPGDNKFDFSVGLSVNLGRIGFRAHRLNTQAYEMSPHYTKPINDQDGMTASQAIQIGSEQEPGNLEKYPVNNYSGLNSLRARIASAGQNINIKDNANDCSKIIRNTSSDNADSDMYKCGHVDCHGDDSKCDRNCNGENELSSEGFDSTRPYCCYFKINSHELISDNQLDALKEIVSYAQENGKIIHVTGSADSATGTEEINQHLSKDRADYIVRQLLSLGMIADSISVTTLGGISQYNPISKNRMVKIELTDKITSDKP